MSHRAEGVWRAGGGVLFPLVAAARRGKFSANRVAKQAEPRTQRNDALLNVQIDPVPIAPGGEAADARRFGKTFAKSASMTLVRPDSYVGIPGVPVTVTVVPEDDEPPTLPPTEQVGGAPPFACTAFGSFAEAKTCEVLSERKE